MDLSHFSTERGKRLLEYTSSVLSDSSYSYIRNRMNQKGFFSMNLSGKNILFLHGDIVDPYWGKLLPEKIHDIRYSTYDYVFPGIHTSLIIWNLILMWTVLIFETKKDSFYKSWFCGTA